MKMARDESLPPSSKKWACLIGAIVMWWPITYWTSGAWHRYWLLTDGQQSTAHVTQEHWGGHNAVVYEYEVNGIKYTGVGGRNWREQKYRDVRPGDETVVYYSQSHPWISALNKPDAVMYGWPFVFVALVLEVCLIGGFMISPRRGRI